MPSISKDAWTNRVVRAFAALIIVALLGAACHQAATRETIRPAIEAEKVAHVRTPMTADAIVDPFESLAQRDPLEALRVALRETESEIRDYTCLFVKQERVKGRLHQEQDIQVKFRSEPYSVLMEWVRNPDKCERVLYVKGKWPSSGGNERAYADPYGWAVDAILGKRGGILQEIHGALSKTAARRSVDQFGFVSTLQLLVKYCEESKARGEMDLAYLGQSELEGRPTYLFRRRLPYTGEDGFYPERLLLAHLDQETHLPIGVFTWADDAKELLLGSYVIKDIALNPGLESDVFCEKANEF